MNAAETKSQIDLNTPLFEEKLPIIQNEIRKRKNKWTLSSLHDLDYDDVTQILLVHICKKIHLWDQTQKIEPWLNTLISNQIRNLIRNKYSNFSPPCVQLKCDSDLGEEGCLIYGSKCNKCPLYDRWEKSKKNAHDIKLPTSIENSYNEINNLQSNEIDYDRASDNLHAEIKKVLTISEWRIYECLYIKHLSEEETSQKLGLKPSKGMGTLIDHKRIRQVKKIIISKVNKIVYVDKVDLFE
jgi:RNA polymerase sigma factor (sigma-70 family)